MEDVLKGETATFFTYSEIQRMSFEKQTWTLINLDLVIEIGEVILKEDFQVQGHIGKGQGQERGIDLLHIPENPEGDQDQMIENIREEGQESGDQGQEMQEEGQGHGIGNTHDLIQEKGQDVKSIEMTQSHHLGLTQNMTVTKIEVGQGQSLISKIAIGIEVGQGPDLGNMTRTEIRVGQDQNPGKVTEVEVGQCQNLGNINLEAKPKVFTEKQMGTIVNMIGLNSQISGSRMRRIAMIKVCRRK